MRLRSVFKLRIKQQKTFLLGVSQLTKVYQVV